MNLSNKAQLRKMVLEQRMQMGAKQYQLSCRKILQRLLILPEMKSSQVIHCYYPLESKKEVNTKMIFKMIWASDRTILAPRMLPNRIGLTHHEVEKEHDFALSKWGVYEPITPEYAHLAQIDIVVVPMLAGDTNGNRLGYGKGYYDTFLASTPAYKVGLCFDEAIYPELPIEAHDVRLDAIITQNRLILPKVEPLQATH